MHAVHWLAYLIMDHAFIVAIIMHYGVRNTLLHFCNETFFLMLIVIKHYEQVYWIRFIHVCVATTCCAYPCVSLMRNRCADIKSCECVVCTTQAHLPMLCTRYVLMHLLVCTHGCLCACQSTHNHVHKTVLHKHVFECTSHIGL